MRVDADRNGGPYPDQLGMINNTAFFRRDITEGGSGLPLAVTLTAVDVNNNCSAVSGVDVEIWQCDAAGNYSEPRCIAPARTRRRQNPTTNATDTVFSDGSSLELATLTGEAASGYTVTLRIGVSI